jgi:hypothetical protein
MEEDCGSLHWGAQPRENRAMSNDQTGLLTAHRLFLTAQEKNPPESLLGACSGQRSGGLPFLLTHPVVFRSMLEKLNTVSGRSSVYFCKAL